MNELESPAKLTSDVELIAEIQKEYTLKAKIKKRRGLTLFAIYLPEGTVKKVHITSTAVIGLDKKVRTTHKAAFDPKAIYIYALNEENAKRKVMATYAKLLERKILNDLAKFQEEKLKIA